MSVPGGGYGRFGYDGDGTVAHLIDTVAVTNTVLTGAQLRTLNNEDEDSLGISVRGYLALLFPQGRNLAAYFFASDLGLVSGPAVETSNDTTNGLDGTWSTWDTTVFDAGAVATYPTLWASPSFRSNVKAVRFGLGAGGTGRDVKAVHLYGYYVIDLATAGVRALSTNLTYIPDLADNPQDSPLLPVFGIQPYVSNMPAGDPAPGNATVTFEALTDPVPSFAGQLLVSLDGVEWHGTLVLTSGWFSSGGRWVSLDLVQVLYVPPPGADPGHHLCRVKVEVAGYLPAYGYFWANSVPATDPVAIAVHSLLPASGISPGSTVMTAEGFGLLNAAGAPLSNLVLKDAHGVITSVPDDAVGTRIPASAHAYDATRQVSAATVDPAHDRLVFTAPAGLLGAASPVILTTDSGADIGGGGAVTVDGTATTAASAPGTNTAAAGFLALSAVADVPVVDLTHFGFTYAELAELFLYPQTMLPQRRNALTRAPYVVIDGMPQDPPILGALSRSVAYARSWSPTEDLHDQLALGLMGATARWVADAADIAGGDHWNPHFGAAPAFVFDPTAPYPPFVDPDYSYYARHNKLLSCPAMMFDGHSWARFAGPAAQVAFAWIIVAVLHHPWTKSSYDIFASPSAATDPDAATDACLRYDNGYVRSFGNARLSSHLLHPPSYRGRLRPVILAWSEDARGGTLGVVDGLGRHWQNYAHPNRAGYDLRMYLGMNGGVVARALAAEMDVLDILYFNRRANRGGFGPYITKLDGVYGVTGR